MIWNIELILIWLVIVFLCSIIVVFLLPNLIPVLLNPHGDMGCWNATYFECNSGCFGKDGESNIVQFPNGSCLTQTNSSINSSIFRYYSSDVQGLPPFFHGLLTDGNGTRPKPFFSW